MTHQSQQISRLSARLTAWLIPVLLLLSAPCARAEDPSPPAETAPFKLALQGPAADSSSEISGLCWFKDKLVLLPQYPDWDNPGGRARLFLIPRQTLLDHVLTRSTDPIKPLEMELDCPDFSRSIPGYEGFEAMAVNGREAFLTIEAHVGRKMYGYLARGEITPDGGRMAIDPGSLKLLKPQARIVNMAYESIVLNSGRPLLLFEANGLNANPGAEARLYDPRSGGETGLPFPCLEYRVTDGSDMDGEKKFWVINTFWFGHAKSLRPARDELAALHGRGEAHAKSRNVERLVEMVVGPDGVKLSPRPPIQLSPGFMPYNWEGLARLEGPGVNGFILATDKVPGTVLAFVPLPDETRTAKGPASARPEN